MKIVKKIMAAVFVLMALVVIGSAEDVSAKQIKSAGAAQKAALKKVGSATVIEVDMDMERGVLFYDVELLKKNKTYTLKYNSKTGALSEYGWEINIKPYSGQADKLISQSSIQKKALKKVNWKEKKKIDEQLDEKKIMIRSG